MPTTPRLRLRRFTSLLIAVGFTLLLLSGILCFLSPKGRIAHQSQWTIWGLDKEQWIALHLTASALFLLASALHLYFNWRPLLKALRARSKEARGMSFEALGALVVGVLLVVGTLSRWPVLSDLVDWRESFKQGPLVEDEGTAPVPPTAPEATEGDHGGRQGRGAGAGGAGSAGYGRRTLGELCVEKGAELDPVLAALAARGCMATETTTLRDLADALGVHPRDVAALLFGE